MTSPRLELLTFTYIPEDQADDFAQRMLGWNIPIAKPAQEPSPSKPLNLWDYPYYKEDDFKEQALIASFVDKVEASSARLISVTLKELRTIYIVSVPLHYPFRYVLAFRFSATLSSNILSKDALYRHLDKATDETKIFIKAVCPEAQYRPTYWFLTDVSTSLHGLSGTVNEVKSPAGNGLTIERAFPNFSYIIYEASQKPASGETLQQNFLMDYLNITDLGLLSAVAHLTERGFREEWHRLVNKLPETSQPNTGNIQDLCLAQLTEGMNQLYGMQRSLESYTKEYYALKSKLTRTKGLVIRIREKCGGISAKNLFDVVCDDALTIVEDEISNSLTVIETRFKGISDGINVYFNQLNSHRTKKLQTIGHLLQSTAVTGITYKIFADLTPTIPPLKSHLTSQIFLAALLAILSGLATFFLLKRRLE